MNILVLAPHPDDDILGCGGTIAKLAEKGHAVYVCVVTKTLPPLYSQKVIDHGRREEMTAHIMLGVRETIFLDMPSYVQKSYPLNEMITKISEVVKATRASVVYIPYRWDIHIDHQKVNEAAMVALRPLVGTKVKQIYQYETLSETGWYPTSDHVFIPNVYEDIMTTVDKKEKALKLFESQMKEFPATRSVPSATAHAIHRGTMVGITAAEAFMLVREVR